MAHPRLQVPGDVVIVQHHLTALELRVRDNRPWTFRGAANSPRGFTGGRRGDERADRLIDRPAGVRRSCDDTRATGRR